LLGHTRGVILLAAAERGIDVAEYSPAEIKNAVVGTGQATKAQVQFMIKKLLRLKEAPSPSDAADGVAVALCHLNSARLIRRLGQGVG
jgi:crossover junction endodeoxyribonuclease RuvC